MKSLKEQLIAKIKKQSSQPNHNYQINRIGIFGSAARNEQNRESDVDF